MAAALREEDRIVGTGVALVTQSDRGQHRHQCRCRRRQLERADEPSYQGRLGARWRSRGGGVAGAKGQGQGDRNHRPSCPHWQAEPRLGFHAGRRAGKHALIRKRPSQQSLTNDRRRRSWPAAGWEQPRQRIGRAGGIARRSLCVRVSGGGERRGLREGVDSGLPNRVGRPVGPSASGPAHFW
jgi:hypothetical protein